MLVKGSKIFAIETEKLLKSFPFKIIKEWENVFQTNRSMNKINLSLIIERVDGRHRT